MPGARPRIDWTAAVQKLEPDLPARLNRAFFSIDEELRQLRTTIAALQSAGTVPSGPAGGQLGGTYPDPDVRGVRETGGPTLLTLGAVADGQVFRRVGSTVVGDDPPDSASTEGSIFSMVGPAGAAAPVVAYDFTQLDPALTSAQNLAAANQSGNSAYDLISDDGTDILVYSAIGGDQRQMVPHAMPFGARPDGGGLLTAGNGVTTQFARTNGSPAGLRLQAGFTGEILLAVVTLDATNQFHCFSYVGGGGNAQYFLLWDTTGTAWKYLHQHGAAVTDALTLHTTSAAAETNQILQHLTLTRSADMSRVRLYRNGRLVGAGAPITSGLAPTGGAGAELRIGQAVGSRLSVLGTRLFDVELTAAQVRASYQRTFFGVSA